MRKSTKERGKWWTEEDLQVKSWVDLIDEELWAEIASKINLGSEYPKGTQTAVRNITYSAYLNKAAEMIRLAAKPRYRTETELFRVALHHGFASLYNIFCKSNGKLMKDTRYAIFYDALKTVEKKMELAQIISMLDAKMIALSDLIKEGSMDQEQADEIIKYLYEGLPDGDQKAVKSHMERANTGNVRNIKAELRSRFNFLD